MLIRELDLTGKKLSKAEYKKLVPRANHSIETAMQEIAPILKRVKDGGKAELIKLATEFDGITPKEIAISRDELKNALTKLDPQIRKSLEVAIEQVKKYHLTQVPADTSTSVITGGNIDRTFRAVDRVGLYVPGGIASYPSSVIMNVVPAQIAGVSSIALASPPQKENNGLPNSIILATCELLGINEVYAVGGAQAIAMFAYGVKDLCESVDLVTGPMLDAVLPFSKWIDVFCDKGAFSVDDARTILKAGMAKGLLPRIHANQLQEGQGVRLGVELDAASVDHVSHVTEKDIQALSTSKTVATLLPGAEFSTRSAYPDVRPLLEASITVALASDCNPGSSYTTSMPFIIAVAVREMHFSPEQALWSATMGGAKALRRDDIGHLFEGARANFSILNTDSYIHLAYRPGVQLVEKVWRDGLQIK